jgi:hydroxypyruvate isomerase
MPKLAANLTMLFNEVDFLDRLEAAAKAGFTAVEYLFPYPYPKERLAEKLASHRLVQVLHNLPAGNWAAGERGIACHPDRVNEFNDGVGLAIEYAKALGCKQVNCLAGIAPKSVAPDVLRETFVGNLRFAAEALAHAGIRLLIEPINSFDIPGFYLTHTGQAVDIIGEVGSSNLYVQYDIYHMQTMEGELANTIKAELSRIAHIQLADNPGRNEPGTGEINYRFLFGFLDAIGYDGWIGCEYKPKGDTVEGLVWRSAHGVA